MLLCQDLYFQLSALSKWKNGLPMNSSVRGEEKNRMKKVSCQAKGVGTFSFWGSFEAGIQSIDSRPLCH